MPRAAFTWKVFGRVVSLIVGHLLGAGFRVRRSQPFSTTVLTLATTVVTLATTVV